MSKITAKFFEKFVERMDWSGLAKAYQDSMTSWNAKNWKDFIEQIRKKERQELIKKVEHRMKIEKYRSEHYKSEVEYISGKYIGLRYAVQIMKGKLDIPIKLKRIKNKNPIIIEDLIEPDNESRTLRQT
jgi:hypothetical protein